MKEADYINATNLAKLRIAKEVLKDIIAETAEEDGRVAGLIANIAQWCIDLEKKIK